MLGLSDIVTSRPRARLTALPTIARLSFATMPWWNGLAMQRQYRGVFGLDLPIWWDDEGITDRLLRPFIDLAIEGAVMPIIDSRFPFDHARDAHYRLHQRRNIGKIVLIPDDPSGPQRGLVQRHHRPATTDQHDPP